MCNSKCCNIIQISGGVDPETLEFLVQGGDSNDTEAPTSGPHAVNLGAANILHLWSAGSLGIDVQAGSAVVQIEAENISQGAGAPSPSAPPSDATRTFVYFNTTDDSTWYWDTVGTAWVQVAGGTSSPICASDTYANITALVGSLTAGCWYEITDANLPQGASSVVIQAMTASDFAPQARWLHLPSGVWLSGEYDFAGDNLFYAYDKEFGNEMRGLNAVYNFPWRAAQVSNVRAYNVDVLDFSGHNNAIVENVFVTGATAQFILSALVDGELRDVVVDDSTLTINLPSAFGFIRGVKAYNHATIAFDTFGSASEVNTIIAHGGAANINIMAQGSAIVISDLKSDGEVTLTGLDAVSTLLLGSITAEQGTLIEIQNTSDTSFSKLELVGQSILQADNLSGGQFASCNLSGNSIVVLDSLTNVAITHNDYRSASIQHSNSTGGTITENEFAHTGDKPTPCVIECEGGVYIGFNHFINQAVVNIVAPTGGGEIAGNTVSGESYLTLANLALGAIFKDNTVENQSEFNGSLYSGSVVGNKMSSGVYVEALIDHQGAFENNHIRCGMNATIESGPAVTHSLNRLAGAASSPYTFNIAADETDTRVDD